MGWGGFIFGPLFMILVLVITAVVVVLVLRALGVIRTGEPNDAHREEDKSRSILRERFASGEIDEAEFEKLKQTLASHAK